MKGYAGKVATTVKSKLSNPDNAGGYGNTGKAGIAKSRIPDAGNAVGYGNTGKVEASEKSLLLNAGNAPRLKTGS